MPFRPHSLPYQLRALFDAGVATPADIAKSCGVERSRVDGWLCGKTPDRVTEIQVRKVISYHARRKRDYLKLEPEESIVSEVETRLGRGVKEDLDAFDGTRAFTIRNGQGKRIFHCTLPASLPDDSLIEFMESFLERKDPVLRLEAVTQSSPDASS